MDCIPTLLNNKCQLEFTLDENIQTILDSYVWMDYTMDREQIFIQHKLNNQHEIRFGNYLADGYCIATKSVYEFNGCYFHHCPYN